MDKYHCLSRYLFFLFDTVYIKHVCETVEMSAWGRVYYTNTLSAIPLLIILPCLGEQEILAGMAWGVPVSICMLWQACHT